MKKLLNFSLKAAALLLAAYLAAAWTARRPDRFTRIAPATFSTEGMYFDHYTGYACGTIDDTNLTSCNALITDSLAVGTTVIFLLLATVLIVWELNKKRVLETLMTLCGKAAKSS